MISEASKIFSLLSLREKKKISFLLIFILIGTLLELIGIGLVIPILTIILDGKNILLSLPFFGKINFITEFINHTSEKKLVIYSMILLVSIFFLKNLFLIFLAWKKAQFMHGFAASFAQKLFEKYLYQPYVFYLQNNSAILIRNVIDETHIFVSHAIFAVLELLNELLVLTAIFAILFFVEPVGATIVILIFSSLGILFYTNTKKKIVTWGKDRQKSGGLRLQNLYQGFGMIKFLKILEIENKFLNIFKSHNKVFVDAARKYDALQNLPRLAIEFIAVLCLASLVTFMFFNSKPASTIIVTMGVFGVAAFRLMPSMNRILTTINAFKYGVPAIKIIHNELNLKDQNLIPNNLKKHTFNNSLNLSNINFSYSNGKEVKKTIKNVSMKINKGDFVGIIGKTGSGKSTLVDLILGLLKANNGEIKFDEKAIDFNQSKWPVKVGYVPQSIYLLDDTLKNNITLSDNIFNEVNFNKAIKLAQLEDFVSDLPKGKETLLGENGVRLSGGQRQRIGIARALYYDPEILFFDEATSALDLKTEGEFMKSMNPFRGKKTVILVAHRFSTINQCNKIYEVADGDVKLTSLEKVKLKSNELGAQNV